VVAIAEGRVVGICLQLAVCVWVSLPIGSVVITSSSTSVALGRPVLVRDRIVDVLSRFDDSALATSSNATFAAKRVGSAILWVVVILS